MSVIGPRPGLWNQDVLTAERDKYNANDVKPGLTGWAQINGRDELEIPVKAKLDGEYVKKIGLLMDIRCFLGSVGVFAHDDSVVEGGTGEMSKTGRHYTDGKTATELIGKIGFDETVTVDKNIKRKILITGAGSYIGESFRAYVDEYYKENFEIETLDMLDEKWREKDFSSFGIPFTLIQLIGYWKGTKVLASKHILLFLIMLLCASTETLFWRVFFNTFAFYGCVFF